MAPAENSAVSTPQAQFSQTDLPELLPQYYKRLFPYKEFYSWLSYGIDPHLYYAKREFSFTLKDDVYIRYLSFADQEEMEKEILKREPYKIDIGAVFSLKPKDHKTVVSGFYAEEKELVFDIDMTDYDEVRTCCSGAAICQKCWPLMTLAIKILDRALQDDFGFKHRMWVYSGRRGVHCWVCDEQARKLTQAARSAVAEYLNLIKGGENQMKKVNFGRSIHPSIKNALEYVKEFFLKRFLEEQGILDTPEQWKNLLMIVPDDGIRDKMSKLWSEHSTDMTGRQKWKELCKEINNSRAFQGKNLAEEIMCQYVYPRLDINVSKGLNHLLKSPFCVHPKTGRVCIPIDLQKLDEFDPFTVPTISTLCDEIDAYDKKHKNQSTSDEMEVDQTQMQKDDIQAYEKTSLKESIKLFQKFIARMEKDRYIESQKRKSQSGGKSSSLQW